MGAGVAEVGRGLAEGFMEEVCLEPGMWRGDGGHGLWG